MQSKYQWGIGGIVRTVSRAQTKGVRIRRTRFITHSTQRKRKGSYCGYVSIVQSQLTR